MKKFFEIFQFFEYRDPSYWRRLGPGWDFGRLRQVSDLAFTCQNAKKLFHAQLLLASVLISYQIPLAVEHVTLY